MKKVILGVLVFSLLCIFVFPQDKIIDQYVRHEALPEDPGMSTLILKQDKPMCQVLGVYPVPDDIRPVHWIWAADYSTLFFYVEYTAVFKSRVRFHFIWTGPEFYGFTTEWDMATYNRLSYFYVVSNMSAWKKGTYRLTVIAEQGGGGSGAEAVGSCVFRIF